MELLGVEGKEEVEALAILNKFSADHCQVSYLREKMQVIEGRLPKTIFLFQATRFDVSSVQRKDIWASLHATLVKSSSQQVC